MIYQEGFIYIKLRLPMIFTTFLAVAFVTQWDEFTVRVSEPPAKKSSFGTTGQDYLEIQSTFDNLQGSKR